LKKELNVLYPHLTKVAGVGVSGFALLNLLAFFIIVGTFSTALYRAIDARSPQNVQSRQSSFKVSYGTPYAFVATPTVVSSPEYSVSFSTPVPISAPLLYSIAFEASPYFSFEDRSSVLDSTASPATPVPTASPQISPTATPVPTIVSTPFSVFVVVVKDYQNIRRCPKFNCPILLEGLRDTSFDAVGVGVGSDWVQVITSKGLGWMYWRIAYLSDYSITSALPY